jgi:hypothetical protein
MLGASLTSARIEMGRDQLARTSIHVKCSTGEALFGDGFWLVKDYLLLLTL